MLKRLFIISCLLAIAVLSWASELLIPMDDVQTDHLKAYGVAFNALKAKISVKWLLNYRGGSWLMPATQQIIDYCKVAGVRYETPTASQVMEILSIIDQENMDVVVLEKEPKIAIYTPPNSQPWDDAVTMALTYAGIEYETVWDEEVLDGRLSEYDWLHLHHEDFTGQYGKFYGSFRNTPWYQNDVQVSEAMAKKLGFSSVWKLKHKVALTIKNYVQQGGFLFAMCAATDTIDIALAAQDVDIVESVYDGTPPQGGYQNKLDYSQTFAFENFRLVTSPMVYEFSDIDTTDELSLKGKEADYFSLFDFSAKYDPVPAMLTQCHTNVIDGFMGQTTAFDPAKIKKSVIIMGQSPDNGSVKYLHGNLGRGTFTFYGGHDPEDYQHRIGDPETRLELHKNSPGYRLILNNVLFPAAKKKKLKT